MAKARQIIYLIGDAPLVVEWSQACITAGYLPAGKFNANSENYKLPKGFKKSTSVPRNSVCAIELTNSDSEVKRKNIRFLEQHLSPTRSILSSSVTVTVTAQTIWMSDPKRLIGICAFPTLLSRSLIELSTSILTDQHRILETKKILAHLGKESIVVQDRVGMVMPRILCMLINEAFFALTEGTASPQDIDIAMKLGTNYPNGPVEWGNKIGFHNVVSVLDALYLDLHEERYRVAPLLQQLAVSNSWQNI